MPDVEMVEAAGAPSASAEAAGEGKAVAATAGAPAAAPAKAAAVAAAAASPANGGKEGKEGKEGMGGKRATATAGGGSARKRSKEEDDKVPAGGAYVKLYGKFLDSKEDYVGYITELPTFLGRTHSNPPKNFLSLGSSKSISKVHAVVDYDHEIETFTVEVKGKNGLLLRGTFYTNEEEKPLAVRSKDPIRIGSLGFYFLQTTFEKPKLSYAELAVQVFREIGPGIPLGTKELCDLLEKKHRYFETLKDGGRITTLNASLQQALRRSELFMKAGLVKGKSEKSRVCYLLSTDTSRLGSEARRAKETKTEPTAVHMVEKIMERIQHHL